MAESMKFQIEKYQVNLTQDSAASRRRIFLTSVNLSHGIRMRVTLLFGWPKNSFAEFNGIGQANNVGGENFDGSDMTIFCEKTFFEAFYPVLNLEKPVYLTVNYDKLPGAKSSTTKLVTSIELSTDQELPGDADKDPLFMFPIDFGK